MPFRTRRRTADEFTTLRRVQVLERDEYRCVYCGEYGTQVDHVVPAFSGGPATTSNGVAVCTRCNSRKGASMDDRWLVPAFQHLIRVGEDLSWLDV